MYWSGRQKGPVTEGIVIHWAAQYELLTKVMFLGREGAFREATLDLVPLSDGQAVVDVGCGPGTLAIAARRRVGAGVVCAIDPAPRMIAHARRKAERAGVEVDFRVGVIEALPFDDGRFDVVLSSLMLHHLPPEPRCRGLAEVHRVLRPGGVCLVVDLELERSSPLARLRGHVMRSRGASVAEEDNAELMRRLGFEVTTGQTTHRLVRYVRGIKTA